LLSLWAQGSLLQGADCFCSSCCYRTRNTACCLRANFLANAATTSTAAATVHFCCCATAVCLRPL
jgi:hypothetical protein